MAHPKDKVMLRRASGLVREDQTPTGWEGEATILVGGSYLPEEEWDPP